MSRILMAGIVAMLLALPGCKMGEAATTPDGSPPEPAYSAEKGKRTFACFSRLHEAEPRILYWIRKAPLDGHYLMLEFHHPTYRKYSGLEVLLFNDHASYYYRQPGARPNGFGKVELGTYHVRIPSGPPAETPLYLELGKNRDVAFELQGASLAPAKDVSYTPIDRNVLEYEEFYDELRDLVFTWVMWHAQSASAGTLPAERLSALKTLTQDCRGLDRRIDSALERLDHAAP